MAIPAYAALKAGSQQGAWSTKEQNQAPRGFEPAFEFALNGIGSLDVPSPLSCEIGDDFVTERSRPFLERLFGTLLPSRSLRELAFPQRQ